jgi:methyl halide transferase
MIPFDQHYWTQRYVNDEAQWDLGAASTPIQTYIDQLTNKNIAILIPGAGNGYEAEYLFKNGFTNVTVIDISNEPLKNIQQRIPNFPEKNLILGDFFEHESSYDLILEQTFFCALDPSLRKRYAEKMNQLLKPKGKLVGVLFSVVFDKEHPPFGGTKEEYDACFQPYFYYRTFDNCYNSIPPRANRELFIHFEKK